MMDNEQGSHVSWLTSCPSGDVNFKTHLKAASIRDLNLAREHLKVRTGTKTALMAIEAELRRREKADKLDISVTNVPREERRCENCGLLSCCPCMMAGKLTDLRGRKETPGYCGKWRDPRLMPPPEFRTESNATCVLCIHCLPDRGKSGKTACDGIWYDGKPIQTTTIAPSCILYREMTDERQANENAQSAMATEDETGVMETGDISLATVVEPAMVGAIHGLEAGEVQQEERREQAPTLRKFDEAVGLPSPERLQVLAAEIRFLTRLTVENAIAIGQRLLEAKEMVEHSDWGAWLQSNVHYSHPTANKFMKIAEDYANSSAPRNLSLGALYELLSLPKPERDEFIGEVHVIDGIEKRVEDMTTRELRAAVARRKRHEEALEAQLEAKRLELTQAAVDKSSALNALRDKMVADHSEALRKLMDAHGKVVADLKEDLALKDEEISGMEKPDTITVEVEKVVPPPDYEATLEDAKDAATLRREVDATEALIRQVLTRPESMQLMDARLLGTAIDSFLQTARAFPFSGPVLFAGGKAMRTDVFKVHLDKLGLWLAASYTALEGKVLEVPHAGMDD